MRLVVADFVIVSGEHHYRVRFECDDAGNHSWIIVEKDDVRVAEIDNRRGTRKPCVTHARCVVATITGRRPSNAFEAQRRQATKPKLQLVTGEDA